MPKELTTEVIRGCLYTWMLIGRLDGRTPPEITLITSLLLFSKDTLNVSKVTVKTFIMLQQIFNVVLLNFYSLKSPKKSLKSQE